MSSVDQEPVAARGSWIDVPTLYLANGPMRLTAPVEGALRLDIISITGRCVRSLPIRASLGSAPVLRWDGLASDGSLAPSGTYYLRLAGCEPPASLMHVASAGLHGVAWTPLR